MAKQMVFEDSARKQLAAGVSKLARAVCTTLGPRGRNAVLDKGWGSPKVTKDGVTVAEDVSLDDPYENLGAQLVKEAASKTNDVAGDGVQLNLWHSISKDNRFRHNLFQASQNDGGEGAAIRYQWPEALAERPKSNLRTAEEANRQLPEQFVGNVGGDPKFADIERDDFRLLKGSAGIDAGAPLTVTTAEGNGDVLPVEDARPFYDGFGIPGEVGDLVMIGPRKVLARVVDGERSGQVVGFITAISDGVLSAYIPLLEVLPGWRSQGIGGELVTLVPGAEAGDDLRLYDTHLAAHRAPDERIAQAERVAALVRAEAPTLAVVAGDLNAPGEVEVIRSFHPVGLRDPGGGPTNPAIAPRQRLDYVLVPESARVTHQWEADGGEWWWALSDHVPVVVEFER